MDLDITEKRGDCLVLSTGVHIQSGRCPIIFSFNVQFVQRQTRQKLSIWLRIFKSVQSPFGFKARNCRRKPSVAGVKLCALPTPDDTGINATAMERAKMLIATPRRQLPTGKGLAFPTTLN
jgi:hypothetical protein